MTIADPLHPDAAPAAEIRSSRSELLALANTTYGERSIFNGTASGAAYDANGVYLGNSASIIRDVAPSTSIAVNLTGPQIFGTAGGPVGDVFEVLDRLATALVDAVQRRQLLEAQRRAVRDEFRRRVGQEPEHAGVVDADQHRRAVRRVELGAVPERRQRCVDERGARNDTNQRPTRCQSPTPTSSSRRAFACER